MAAGPDPLGVGQQVEAGSRPGVEAGAQLVADGFGALEADLRGGQFQGERDALQTYADLAGGAGGGEVLPGGPAEQLQGVASGGRQRVECDDVLPLDAERPAAGGEDGEAGGGGEEFGDEPGAGLGEVLAGVEDEEQPAVGEPAAESGGTHAGGVVGEVDGVGDERDEEPVAVELGQVGPPGAVRERAGGAVRGAQREPGLPDSPDAGHGDEAVLRQRGGHALQFRAASHETGVLVRQMSTHGSSLLMHAPNGPAEPVRYAAEALSRAGGGRAVTDLPGRTRRDRAVPNGPAEPVRYAADALSRGRGRAPRL
ncbi:hypothetical protein STANM309S_03937 [Streptomyces tanashiensis]